MSHQYLLVYTNFVSCSFLCGHTYILTFSFVCVCVVGVGVFPFKSSRFDRVGGFLSWLLGVGVGSCLVWVGTMVGVVVQ